MLLQDHFHPPLSLRRHWHAFHNAWATYISSDLNRELPEGYFAEANVQFGIEIDVAAFEETGGKNSLDAQTATGNSDPRPHPSSSWSPPEPLRTLPMTLLGESVEVAIFGREGGPTLAGAIELVSPANKDRPAHREAFVSKCAGYVQQGIGLLIIDVVTDRTANLHDDLMARLGTLGPAELLNNGLYTSAYRPVLRQGEANLDIWYEGLAVDHPLPTMPLWLPSDLCIAVDLQGTYERTCREQRLTALSA